MPFGGYQSGKPWNRGELPWNATKTNEYNWLEMINSSDGAQIAIDFRKELP
jgi:hypothetical protein